MYNNGFMICNWFDNEDNNSSIYRDLAIMYTNENWFVILFVVDILGTEIPKYLTLVR